MRIIIMQKITGHFCCLLAVFIFVVAAADNVGNKKLLSKAEDFQRLPRTILPLHYQIRLLPFLEEGNFTTHGYEEILVQCSEDSANVTLHSADIIIDRSSVKLTEVSTSRQIEITDVSEDPALQLLVITPAEALTKGQQFVLSMSFISKLNDEMRGFYRSSYTEEGQTKYLAVTQMEPCDARRAFPCFDEPNMKSNFTITLGRKEEMTAASNMPLRTTEPIEGLPGYVWDHFETSVPMSSYLVAMMVSEFNYAESNPDLSNVLFRIWARPAAQNQTEYARNIGPRILETFEEFFGINYPLPKQDMAAIPDFAPGAMENWGLITYKETALLYDPRRSSASDKQFVCLVIAHELAHQWFGDLVTMDWWNGLWLNEGFARYMQYIGTEAVEPGFQIKDQALLDDIQYVFGIDALESSRPINIEVNTPSEISELFDPISYEKGASILRMLVNFLGEETFRLGLNRYLTSKMYGNAVQDDLWSALTEQAAIDGVGLPADIKTIMDTWTLKMGYPVVTVSRDYSTGSANVTQERFLLRKSANSTDPTVYQWWVPLTYTSDFSGQSSSAWIPESSVAITIADIGASGNQWVIFNVDENGYYRVNYDSANWRLVSNQLLNDHSRIGVKNRAQLLDDGLNLARANLVHYETALELTRYLGAERQYVPWKSALVGLDYIDLMLHRSGGYGSFKHYMSSIVKPLYDHVTFNETQNEAHLVTYSRVIALSWACKLGIPECVDSARSAFTAWMAGDENAISANLLAPVSCTAVENGGEAEWNFVYDRYLKSNVAAERSVLLAAMACTRQEWILARILEWSIDPSSGIRRQDSKAAFTNVASNSVGRYLAFDFIRNRWDDLYNYFTLTFGSVAELIDAVANGFNTPLEVEELKQLRDIHAEELGAAVRTVDQTIERCQANIQWMDLHYAEVVSWFEQHSVVQNA